MANCARLSLALGSIAMAIASSPATAGKNVVTKALAPALPKGYECLQGPNSLDHAGRTFYVDSHGVEYDLTDLGGKVHPITGDVSDVALGSSGQISAGLLAKILGIGGILSVKASKKYETSIALNHRQEIRTEEADARAAIRSLDPSVMDDSNRYYIIRNVQMAQQLRLQVDRGVAAAFGGTLPISSTVTLSGAATPPAVSPPKTPGATKATTPTTSPTGAAGAGAAAASSGTGGSTATAAATPPKISSPSPTVGGAITLGAGGVPTGTATVALGSSGSGAPKSDPSSSSSSAPIISAEDDHTYTIDQTYDKPFTVCYLAQRFTLKNVTGGVGGAIKDAELKDEYWNPSAGK